MKCFWEKLNQTIVILKVKITSKKHIMKIHWYKKDNKLL